LNPTLAFTIRSIITGQRYKLFLIKKIFPQKNDEIRANDFLSRLPAFLSFSHMQKYFQPTKNIFLASTFSWVAPVGWLFTR
jgi:hypothetical protein